MAAIIVLMMAATVIGKLAGDGASMALVYHNPVFILLWGVAAVAGVAWLVRRGVAKRPVVFLMHFSFLLMLAGALVTHLFSNDGRLHIRTGSSAVTYETSDGRTLNLHFTLYLESFDMDFYPGTMTPMDYRSTVRVDGDLAVISMNKILRKNGYRFYQSSYDDDGRGTVLSVAYDPVGVPLTYAGYFLLFISLILFFFCRDTYFRTVLKRSRAVLPLALFLVAGTVASAEPKSVPSEVADRMGELLVYYNGRVAPLQTMARDYAMKVYGKPSYKGYSAEQVVCGWYWYPESWADVPMKIKKKEAGKPAETEKYYVLRSVAAARSLNLFPRTDSEALGRVAQHLQAGDVDAAIAVIDTMAAQQRAEAGRVIPSRSKLDAEHLYNRIGRPMPLAMASVTIGLILFMLSGILMARGREVPVKVRACFAVLSGLAAAYLTLLLAIRWYVSGHVPMVNGFEMMLLIAWLAMLFTTASWRALTMLQPLGCILAGFALLVAVLGESNPQITPLVPVLSSPLLSIHVATMMISYTLFGVAALNGILGLVLRGRPVAQKIADTGLLLIYPGLFLLTAGTFLGAIWANVSWGSYWAWDPKETWALITMLIYAAGIHGGSLPAFRKPAFFNLYCVLAFLSVLITYFGVNFLLGGMHSYA